MLRISTLLLMLASTLPAYAKERSATAQALKLSALGIMYYRDGDYVQAIARFREAYARQKRPDLLYNIAQAYRKIGDCPSALDHYQRYLVAEPTAYNRTRIEERIYEMEQCVQGNTAPQLTDQPKDDKIEAPPPPVEAAKPPPPIEPPLWPAEPEPPRPAIVKPPPQPMRGRKAVRVIGLVSIGAGLAMTAAAAGLTATAASTADQVARLYQDGGQWNDEFAQVDSRGRAASSAAAGLYTVGAAAIAGGGAMVWLGWRTPR
jgi:tetratricopeptide (TPR) repeat protein